MAEQASAEQVNLFIRKTDEFFAKYAKLTAPDFRKKVYATGDKAIIAAYESEVSRATSIKNSIDTTVGYWQAFKQGYAAVTGVTSTWIGDAVDEIRSWFGYSPAGGFSAYDISPITGGQLGRYSISPISGGQLGALGAVPVIMAVWVTGILAVMVISIRAQDKIFMWVDAWFIKRDNPNMTTGDALDKAAQVAARGGLFEGAALPLLAAAALAAFLIFGKKK
jgi:hypothetical protein